MKNLLKRLRQPLIDQALKHELFHASFETVEEYADRMINQMSNVELIQALEDLDVRC